MAAPPSASQKLEVGAAVKMKGKGVMSFLGAGKEGAVDSALRKTIFALLKACKAISYMLRTDTGDQKGTTNAFGDDQLDTDVMADKLVFEHLQACGCVHTASSEETPKEVKIGGKGYSVAFDPLDGSSVIGSNFSVGTIFGVWPGDKLVGVTGKSLKCAGMAVYGPRTTITLAVDGIPGAHEFMLVDDRSALNGSWVHTKAFTSIKEGRLFAPGNLRATNDNEGYAKLLDFWRTNAYTLRYTGGMVPDVNQILIKGKGIFVNPVSKSHKAKLRLLYEAIPVAYIVEKAGGASSEGDRSLLEVKINSTQDRTQVAYGSAVEVKRFEEFVGKKYLSSL